MSGRKDGQRECPECDGEGVHAEGGECIVCAGTGWADPPFCSSCGAAVTWKKGEPGKHGQEKRIIVDRAPVANGNIVVRSTGLVHYLTKDEKARVPDGVTRYVSHFTTCPQAREWRTP